METFQPGWRGKVHKIQEINKLIDLRRLEVSRFIKSLRKFIQIVNNCRREVSGTCQAVYELCVEQRDADFVSLNPYRRGILGGYCCL